MQTGKLKYNLRFLCSKVRLQYSVCSTAQHVRMLLTA